MKTSGAALASASDVTGGFICCKLWLGCSIEADRISTSARTSLLFGLKPRAHLRRHHICPAVQLGCGCAHDSAEVSQQSTCRLLTIQGALVFAQNRRTPNKWAYALSSRRVRGLRVRRPKNPPSQNSCHAQLSLICQPRTSSSLALGPAIWTPAKSRSRRSHGQCTGRETRRDSFHPVRPNRAYDMSKHSDCLSIVLLALSLARALD